MVMIYECLWAEDQSHFLALFVQKNCNASVRLEKIGLSGRFGLRKVPFSDMVLALFRPF